MNGKLRDFAGPFLPALSTDWSTKVLLCLELPGKEQWQRGCSPKARSGPVHNSNTCTESDSEDLMD